MSVTEQQVESLLENVLFQSSTQAAANAGSWLGLSGVSTLSGLAAAMAASPEESIAAHVVGYYLSALGRAPTATEIRYYVGVAEQGLTQTQIAAGQVASSTWDTIASYFTQSPEFIARAGLDMSLGEIPALFEAVPWLYQSVLGRAPSGAELSYYDSQIGAGGGLNTLFREFTASPEFAVDTSSQIAAALAAYGTAVASGQDPATIGGTVTLGPPAPPTSTPPPAPTPTPTALTTGTDTFTTTDSALIFTGSLGGVAPTLTSNDSLHGNGNSFAITDTSGATSQDLIPTGVSLTGISTVTLTTSGNAGTDANHPFDLLGVTGPTSFTLESSGIQGDFINAGSATSVSITTHGIGDIVAIASNSLATLSLSGTLTGVTLTDAAGGTALTVDVTGVSLTGGFTDASNHLTSLTIAASGAASSISSLSDSALASLSLSGDVTLGSAGAPIVFGIDSFAVSGSSDAGSASLEFLLTGTQGGTGVDINSAGSGGNGGAGGIAGGGTIMLGDGTDKFADHGAGGNGGNGGSATTGSGGDLGGDGGSGGGAGQETVTFGNGTDTLVIDSSGGNGGDGGSATVTGGGGGDIAGNGGRGGDGGHDTLTLGNGNDTVADDSQGGDGGNGGAAQAIGGGASGGNGGSGGDGGHHTLTLGDGNNTVTDNSQGGNGGNGGAGQATGAGSTGGNGGSGGDGGHNTITVGNGNNIVTDDSLGGTGGAAGSAEFSGSAGAAGSGGNDVITVGTGTNTIDLGHHGNDTVILGTDARFASAPTTANQTIENAASGDQIGFSLDGSGLTIQIPSISTTNTATLLTDLEAAVTGQAKTAAFGTDGTNSYLVENHGLTLGADTTVIVEILGVHTVNTGTANFVELTS